MFSVRGGIIDGDMYVLVVVLEERSGGALDTYISWLDGIFNLIGSILRRYVHRSMVHYFSPKRCRV